VCVGKDRLDAKREVKEETEMAKVLPGFVPGCRLGSSVMKSVTRVVIGRSSQARAWKDRLLRHRVTT